MSPPALSRKQQQYLHLVRLAWNLHEQGVGSLVELPCENEPAVVITAPSGRLKIMAAQRRRGWVYAWGRSRTHSAKADAESAARQLAEWVNR